MSKNLSKRKYLKPLRIVDIMCVMQTRHFVRWNSIVFLARSARVNINSFGCVYSDAPRMMIVCYSFKNQSMFLKYLAVSSLCTALTLISVI